MTEAEKLAAQREAQHDLAARGRRPTQESLQHYLAHERHAHAGDGHAPPHGHGATAVRPAPARPSDEPPVQVPAPRTGGLLGRLFRGRR